jgi:AAA domain
MLHRLAIRDFVIVDALEIELGSGLTVLSGETGAGKSILVDALQLALGGRGDAGVVREGAPSSTRHRRWPSGWPKPASKPIPRTPAGCCFGARSTRRERAAPGSTAVLRRPRNFEKSARRWSTSTASTPGKA